MKRLLPIALVILTGCKSQLTLDRAAFEAAAVKCEIKNLYFEPEKGQRWAAGRQSLSPFRQYGDWLNERRRRQQGVVRRYLVNVPAVYVGSGFDTPSPEWFAKSRVTNRNITCLANELALKHIAVRSMQALIVG